MLPSGKLIEYQSQLFGLTNNIPILSKNNVTILEGTYVGTGSVETISLGTTVNIVWIFCRNTRIIKDGTSRYMYGVGFNSSIHIFGITQQQSGSTANANVVYRKLGFSTESPSFNTVNGLNYSGETYVYLALRCIA